MPAETSTIAALIDLVRGFAPGLPSSERDAALAPLPEAGVLGLYGAAFAWRWFARNMAYIDGRMHAAIASDLGLLMGAAKSALGSVLAD